MIFLLPFHGEISMATLEKKATKISIPPERVHDIVKRLVPEGFVSSYIQPPDSEEAGTAYRLPAPLVDMQHERRVVARGDVVSMTKMQVRKLGDSPMLRASAVYFNTMTEDVGRSIPTKTPNYRVIPVEATLTEKAERRKITLNAVIPDPREVLPIDVVSEMVRKEPIIAVAECYCRRTKVILGEGCDHPLETCLYFNKLALLQIESGHARQIDYDEAIRILHECEEAGLVHNISNCEGGISSLCARCICSCGAMKSLKFGGTNGSGPSRFIVSHDESKCVLCETCAVVCPIEAISISNQKLVIEFDRCIGCGPCVFNCPEGSLHMVVRGTPPKIFADDESL